MNDKKSSLPAWATIRAGSLETRYARAGAGRPVLLLATPDGELPAAALFTALARECRVFAPRLPRAGGREDTATPAWLRGLIDGLGLQRPAVIAAPGYAELAQDFAINDSDRVGGLILLGDDPAPSDGSGGDGVRRMRGQLTGGRSVLRLAVSPSARQDWEAVAREVIHFLVEAATAPAS